MKSGLVGKKKINNCQSGRIFSTIEIQQCILQLANNAMKPFYNITTQLACESFHFEIIWIGRA